MPGIWNLVHFRGALQYKREAVFNTAKQILCGQYRSAKCPCAGKGQRRGTYPGKYCLSGAAAPRVPGLCRTLERELAPLRKIQDNYPKYLLTLDELFNNVDYEGIKKRNVLEWLLKKSE